MNTFLTRMKKHRQTGFTLVELMVVVAIIGILSAVAIPNFKEYQAKSKTAEAKLQLASIFTAQTSFQADYDTYATCLLYMGYNPASEAANRYYAVGHSAAHTSPISVPNCTNANDQFAAGKFAHTAAAAVTDIPTTVVSQTAFTAGAGGNISTTAAKGLDQWTIDQNKALSHARKGY